MIRRHLTRAGAGAMAVVATVSLAQALSYRDVQPVRSLPVVSRVAVTPAVQQARARPPGQEAPAESAEVVPTGRERVRVPILMYHYIRTNPDPRDKIGFGLSVTPGDFAQQMSWLASNGYHPIDLADLRAYLRGQTPLPAKPVVLTFDDGYRDLYTTAYPILRAHRFKAVAYVVSGFLGSPANVTAEQVLEMEAGGVQVGSHTVSHVDLTRASPSELRRELVESRASLEALVGHPVVDFCYPAGRYNDAVVRAVQASGYESATTTEPGSVHGAADRFLWSRIRVSGGESLSQFAADLQAVESTVPRAQAAGSPPVPAPLVIGPLLPPLTAPPAALAGLGPTT